MQPESEQGLIKRSDDLKEATLTFKTLMGLTTQAEFFRDSQYWFYFWPMAIDPDYQGRRGPYPSLIRAIVAAQEQYARAWS